ncbi:MAG: hypothetical protein ACREAY_02755, partial [Nitrososphaera sp.]|uniref:hypothetical protein n=1 Tax=Nitrososphaera sp. TaxID=1971748 RepID=UPI003D6ED32F
MTHLETIRKTLLDPGIRTVFGILLVPLPLALVFSFSNTILKTINDWFGQTGSSIFLFFFFFIFPLTVIYLAAGFSRFLSLQRYFEKYDEE